MTAPQQMDYQQVTVHHAERQTVALERQTVAIESIKTAVWILTILVLVSLGLGLLFTVVETL